MTCITAYFQVLAGLGLYYGEWEDQMYTAETMPWTGNSKASSGISGRIKRTAA